MTPNRLLAALTFAATLTTAPAVAQHAPGGVPSPRVWGTDGAPAALTDTIPPSAGGLTTFQVVVPSASGEDATLTTGLTLVTSRRVAEPSTAQYINFAVDGSDAAPRLVTVRRRLSEADTAAVLTSGLPLTGTADSICETIAYARMLSAAERQRVDTYLALRHGVTLDQTSPASYVASDSRTVWDAVARAAHSHRIAGLCADTLSHLYRPVATAAATDSLLVLAADTLPPMAYILCGDDDGALRYVHADGAPRRVARTWLISATGDEPPSLTLSFDASRIEEAFPLQAGEHYWLATSDSACLRSDDLGPDAALFHDVAVHDGMTFTLLAAAGDDAPEPETPSAAEPGSRFRAVSVSPNPTTDGLVALRISLQAEAPVTVTLHSEAGRPFASASHSGSDYYALTLRLPAAGIWFATLRSGASTRTFKLVRQ